MALCGARIFSATRPPRVPLLALVAALCCAASCVQGHARTMGLLPKLASSGVMAWATDCFMSLFLKRCQGRHYGTLRSTDFLGHPPTLPTTRGVAGAMQRN